jgi:rhodanese-related sulfurtransferase
VARTTLDDLLAEARDGLERLTPAQAREAQAAGAVVLDIRSREQRRADGEVPGALRHPRNVLEWRVDPDSAHRDPAVGGVDAHLVVLCAEGYQSSRAAATLQRPGFPRATDVVGGFAAWLDAGLPVESPMAEG